MSEQTVKGERHFDPELASKGHGHDFLDRALEFLLDLVLSHEIIIALPVLWLDGPRFSHQKNWGCRCLTFPQGLLVFVT
jgi:hypothetical protein